MGKTDYGHYVETPVIQSENSIRIAAGEKYRKVVLLKKGSDNIPFNHIILETDSFLEICFVILPGADFDLTLITDLVGHGANVNIYGTYICSDDEKVSITTDIRHRVPHCISNQMINGIAGGSSKASFNGRIVVAPNAQKTEAYQSNHNVVLCAKAKVETNPQLEIYADDVKCSHGATIGALNEDEIFYMRSRGISEAEAKFLQMLSFVSPILNKIKQGTEREKIMTEVSKAIKEIL